MARDLTTIIGIDLEIARLWNRYRRIGTSALLVEIDKLLDARHVLAHGPEMVDLRDVAPVSEWGAADLGEATA